MPDVAIHSDFLIHWTGKDLDAAHDRDWYAADSSRLTGLRGLVDLYVERLRSILEYGLWLTTEPAADVAMPWGKVTIPSTPKVCFTELKLSQSRVHAKRYGRLGIGVKRPYVHDRSGRPIAYVCYDFRRNRDPLLKALSQNPSNRGLLNFFKPMNASGPLNYDLYSESEWRILYFRHLIRRRLVVNPRLASNKREHSYYNGLCASDQRRLRYLAPLDGWLAMIIYPSLSVKNAAMRDRRIRDALRRLKANPTDHANQVEDGSWPIELNLDACQHF